MYLQAQTLCRRAIYASLISHLLCYESERESNSYNSLTFYRLIIDNVWKFHIFITIKNNKKKYIFYIARKNREILYTILYFSFFLYSHERDRLHAMRRKKKKLKFVSLAVAKKKWVERALTESTKSKRAGEQNYDGRLNVINHNFLSALNVLFFNEFF